MRALYYIIQEECFNIGAWQICPKMKLTPRNGQGKMLRSKIPLIPSILPIPLFIPGGR